MPAHEFDAQNLYAVLTTFPEQFVDALEASRGTAVPKPEQVVIAGVGGSALPGDIVNTYLRGEALLYMNRDYGVPHWVSDKTLVICVSYSGDTEETIESFHDARDRGAGIVVISSGGELKRLASEFTVPMIVVPSGFQPRCATGYLFTSILAVLMNSGVVENGHAAHIRDMARELSTMEFEEEAERVAKQLKGHVPIIYSSEQFHSLARIWKIKINENAKIQAFHNAFPELNHNEMVGFTNLIMKPFVIFLQNQADHARVHKRVAITKTILAEKKIPAYTVTMRGATRLTQIFSTLLLGDWVSYYLAREYGADPTPVQLVEDFKQLMKE